MLPFLSLGKTSRSKPTTNGNGSAPVSARGISPYNPQPRGISGSSARSRPTTGDPTNYSLVGMGETPNGGPSSRLSRFAYATNPAFLTINSRIKRGPEEVGQHQTLQRNGSMEQNGDPSTAPENSHRLSGWPPLLPAKRQPPQPALQSILVRDCVCQTDEIPHVDSKENISVTRPLSILGPRIDMGGEQLSSAETSPDSSDHAPEFLSTTQGQVSWFCQPALATNEGKPSKSDQILALLPQPKVTVTVEEEAPDALETVCTQIQTTRSDEEKALVENRKTAALVKRQLLHGVVSATIRNAIEEGNSTNASSPSLARSAEKINSRSLLKRVPSARCGDKGDVLPGLRACERSMVIDSVELDDGEVWDDVPMESSSTNLTLDGLWVIQLADIQRIVVHGRTNSLDLYFYAPTVQPENMIEGAMPAREMSCYFFNPSELLKANSVRYSLGHPKCAETLQEWRDDTTNLWTGSRPFHISKVTLDSKKVKSIAMTIQMSRSSLNAILMTKLSKVRPRSIQIIHFANVCQLAPATRRFGDKQRKVGGVSRYMRKLVDLQAKTSRPYLIMGSGNFLGPSLLSVETKGRQMIEALNCLGMNYATFGFYEFSYGLKALKDCLTGFAHNNFVYSGSKATWVCSNLKEKDGSGVAGAVDRALFVWDGVRVGVLGLCENFLAECRALSPGEVVYSDMEEVGSRISEELVAAGAEIVIALTSCTKHMDQQLRNHCHYIDVILGGRERGYKYLRRSAILKSGSDFDYLSELSIEVPIVTPGPAMLDLTGSLKNPGARVRFEESSSPKVASATIKFENSENPLDLNPTSASGFGSSGSNTPRSNCEWKGYNGRLPLVLKLKAYPILSSDNVHEPMEHLIAAFHTQLSSRLNVSIGRTVETLDPFPRKTHHEEGLLSNFIADLMCDAVDADFAIISGSAIGGTAVVHPNTNFTVGDVVSWFPYDTKAMCITLTGRLVVRLLNAMVKSYSVTTGTSTFPHVSKHLSFVLNCIGGQPRAENVCFGGEPIDLEEVYSVGVEDTMGRGRDIYSFLVDNPSCEVLVSLENAVQLASWTRNYFTEKKGQVTSGREIVEGFGEFVPTVPELKRKGSSSDSEEETKLPSGSRMSMSRSAEMNMAARLPRGVLLVKLQNFRPYEFSQTLDHKKVLRIYRICSRLTQLQTLHDLSGQLGSVFTSMIECEGVRFLLLDLAGKVLKSSDFRGRVELRLDEFSLPVHALNDLDVLHVPDLHHVANSQVSQESTFAQLAPTSSSALRSSCKETNLTKFRVASGPSSPRPTPPRGERQSSGKGREVTRVLDQNRLKDPRLHHGRNAMDQASLFSGDDLTSSLTIPVMYRGTPLGVVQIFNKMTKDADGLPVRSKTGFSEEEIGIALLLARQVAVQTHFNAVYQQVRKSESATRALLTMTSQLNVAAREESVSKMIMKITEGGKSLLCCDRCSLFLVDKQEMWTVVPTQDYSDEVEIRLPAGQGTVGKCAETCEMMNVHDAYQCDDFNPEIDRQTGYHTKTIFCLPLLDEVTRLCTGVVQFINKKDGTVFSDHDAKLAEQFGRLAMVALRDCTHMEMLRGADTGNSTGGSRGLQVLPVLDAGRVVVKLGWHTIRRNIKKICTPGFSGHGTLPREAVDKDGDDSAVSNPVNLNKLMANLSHCMSFFRPSGMSPKRSVRWKRTVPLHEKREESITSEASEEEELGEMM